MRLKPAKFKIGDRVRLHIAPMRKPEHGWGSVSNGDIGTVIDTSEEYGQRKVFVKFAAHPSWVGLEKEFVFVEEKNQHFLYLLQSE